jgi:nucleoside phosphorylase
MLGLLFSTPNDAVAFVNQCAGARLQAPNIGEYAQVNDILVGVTGVGKIQATLQAERMLQNHNLDALFHAGLCTPVADDLPGGELFGVSFVLEGDRVELDAPTYPRMPLECPLDTDHEGTLVSQDHTSDDDERSYWERLADVRDSTGYPVAYVAAQHGTPCHIIKAIAPPDNTEDFRSALATFLDDELND